MIPLRPAFEADSYLIRAWAERVCVRLIRSADGAQEGPVMECEERASWKPEDQDHSHSCMPVDPDLMDPRHVLAEGVADMIIPLDRPIVHL